MPAADDDPRPPWQYLMGLAQQWADRIRPARIAPTSRNGVSWDQHPLPRRWHRCWAQSWGSVGPFRLVERCPCGGTRLDGKGRWLYRNRRRHQKHGTGPERGGENVAGDQPPLMTEMRETLREEPDDA